MKADEVLNEINFPLLKEQKGLLLETINNNAVSPKHKEALEGILLLVDEIQNYAVDELGINEYDVFNFTEQ